MRPWKYLFVVALSLAASAIPVPAQTPVAPLRLFGFGDFNYVATERDIPAGFRTGQIAAHGVAGLTPRLTIFGEVSATPSSSGYALEIERLIVRHDFSDFFKLSAGRYHTPVSYWNTAFHHGQWLQTSVARPEMIRFGGTLLPIHFIGVQAEGSFPRQALNPGYAVGLGNGRHQNLARAGDAGDVNTNRAVLASGHMRPHALFGLNIGGSFYIDRFADDTAGAIDERITAAYVALEQRGPEFIAELARVHHRTDAASAAATARYLQLGYRLPSAASPLKPYLRVERVDVGESPIIPHFAGHQYRAALGGLRFDFAPMAALKLEMRNEKHLSNDWLRSLLVQLSFAIGPSDGSHDHQHTATPPHTMQGIGALR